MMSEKRFRRWALAAVIAVALVPWVILPWATAVVVGPITAVLGASYFALYVVRTNRMYRRQ